MNRTVAVCVICVCKTDNKSYWQNGFNRDDKCNNKI